MFEITADDIVRINDSDLRTLVARLAAAEIERAGGPISAVTAGGAQDAPDGGIDVRVELARPLGCMDFVPRALTGFQVKRPDMPRTAILAEMRFGGNLRPSITALAEANGAYVIACAQGSVSDQALADRRGAMREALEGHAGGEKLHVDFYDRTRLAAWASQYPGVAAWVRERTGRAIAGWHPIGLWAGARVAVDGGYLANDKACLVEESTRDRTPLPILEGITKLRNGLARPGHCIRLVGLSGLGKTRLVQALFEDGVGDTPLDPSIALYTDYSEPAGYTARDLAIRLIEDGRRAILVVDNCNPATHRQLAEICAAPNSTLSLLSVEYDVRDDEPEFTEVVRLSGVDSGLVEQWLAREHAHVGEQDGRRISEFSAGNFRIARALAQSLRRGETLGRLRDDQLFERVVFQRYGRDEQLLADAQILALVYSFDGKDGGEGTELAALGAAFGRDSEELFSAAATLRDRGIVQARGQWRAILPQAIANRLASNAIDRTAPAALDRFAVGLTPRLFKSFAKRLGFLHDSSAARRSLARWLSPGGLLHDLPDAGGEGMGLIELIAPVDPGLVLDLLLTRLAREDRDDIVNVQRRERWRWGRLLKLLAYEPGLFDRAAFAMARFAGAEPVGHNSDSVARSFGELFHLVLSGTHAPPAQRRALIDRLLAEPDPRLLRAGEIALKALLETGHFSAVDMTDFGARPRDHGWRPTLNREGISWYVEAIALAERHIANLAVRESLAGALRGLWRHPACHDAIARVVDRLASEGGWLGGWTALRGARRFDAGAMDSVQRSRLDALIAKLAPVDLLGRARAFVLAGRGGGWDVIDGDEGDIMSAYAAAGNAAFAAGQAMANESDLLDIFVPEVVANVQAPRSFGFGRGLGAGAENVDATWARLIGVYRATPANGRSAVLLTGFLAEIRNREGADTAPYLDEVLVDDELRSILPQLQAYAGLDRQGIDRLLRAVARGTPARAFQALASGVIGEADGAGLPALLLAIGRSPNGGSVALDLFQMRRHCAADDPALLDEGLHACGRQLLAELSFDDQAALEDHWLDTTIELCLSGEAHVGEARALGERMLAAFANHDLYWHDAEKLVAGLFKAQPRLALDLFLAGAGEGATMFWKEDLTQKSPLETVDEGILIEWANIDPAQRFPAIAAAHPMFVGEPMQEEQGLSPRYLTLLNESPDKIAFLAASEHWLTPSSWWGSLSARLEKRLSLLEPLRDLADPAVDTWLASVTDRTTQRIAAERVQERRDEERFE